MNRGKRLVNVVGVHWRKICLTLPVGAALAAVSGCSPGVEATAGGVTTVQLSANQGDNGDGDVQGKEDGDAGQGVTGEELPPGFFLSGEFVELGPWDQDGGELNLIKPCSEIPKDLLLDIGMVEDQLGDAEGMGVWTCLSDYAPLTDVEEGIFKGGSTIGISSTSAPLEQFYQLGKVLDRANDTEVPGLVFHESGTGSLHSCNASIETRRGLLSVSVDSADGLLDLMESCAIAGLSMERMYANQRG